jgi:hypothetical protein
MNIKTFASMIQRMWHMIETSFSVALFNTTLHLITTLFSSKSTTATAVRMLDAGHPRKKNRSQK